MPSHARLGHPFKEAITDRSLFLASLLFACSLASLVAASPCEDIDFNTVIFRDDFTGPDGSSPDSSLWTVNFPDEWWHVLGRTFMPSPTYHPDAPFPHIKDNACLIEHYQFNPYDDPPSGEDKWTFLGGEIHSKVPFDPSRCYRFEARVRWPECPGGLVASFFTYGYDATNEDSDEIDYEFLSNKIFVPPREVLINKWNDSQQDHEYIVMPPEFDPTEWQTFCIYWCPSECVKWTWINPVTDAEEELRAEEGTAFIPDETMFLHFNFWAPTEDWADAYDAAFEADQEDHGTKYDYWIDYAEVRVPEPGTCVLITVGTLAYLTRRRR